MSSRQRVAMAFVGSPDGRVLMVKRPASAPTYPNRYTTVSGPIDPGESPVLAASRAVHAELGLRAESVRAGLPLDFEDTIKKKSITFRIHPFLFTIDPALCTVEGARWVHPDDVIIASAVAETVPELDEALARVWDPPAALPPQFRSEARAIAADPMASTDLAVRAIALVAGGAPAERVAAVRPSLARLVNAVRAAARPGRDVPAELIHALRTAERDIASELAVAHVPRARVAVLEVLPTVPSAVDPMSADLILAVAEALTEAGEAVLPAGALAVARAAAERIVPFIVVADPWVLWGDEVPPPLEPGLELVPRALITRVIGARV